MWRTTVAFLASSTLITSVLAADILKTDGFTKCGNGSSTIDVKNVDVEFDRASNEVIFDVAGTSSEEQEVTAELVVTAYGIEVFSQDFDPCDESTRVDQLCPRMSHCSSKLTPY